MKGPSSESHLESWAGLAKSKYSQDLILVNTAYSSLRSPQFQIMYCGEAGKLMFTVTYDTAARGVLCHLSIARSFSLSVAAKPKY